MVIYTFLTQYGKEYSQRYQTLNEALKAVARDYKFSLNTPLTLRHDSNVYQQQELLLLCRNYRLL